MIDWPEVARRRAKLNADKETAGINGKVVRVLEIDAELAALPHWRWADKNWNDECQERADREQELNEARRRQAAKEVTPTGNG